MRTADQPKATLNETVSSLYQQEIKSNDKASLEMIIRRGLRRGWVKLSASGMVKSKKECISLATQFKKMKTIVTLVDFSDVTAKVIKQSQEMADAFKAKVILLHAVPDVPVVMDLGVVSPTVLEPASEEKKESDYNKLTNLRNSLASCGVNVSVHQLEVGNLDGIFGQCERLAADLIIVGAHRHSALYNWWIGTCTGEVLKRAHCPVLVVPADAG